MDPAVAQRGRAEDGVADVLACRGLGDLGPLVLLAAHDVVAAGVGAGLGGQILTLVRAYEGQTGPGDSSQSPRDAIAQLLASPPRGVEPELVSMFAAWQGREPLGSPVKLEDGQLALVFGPSAHRPELPRIAPLSDDGVLGPDLDLGAAGAPAVVGYPSPNSLQLDFTGLKQPS